MDTLCSYDKDCCGCEACVSVCKSNAITMREDTYGFMYPYISQEKCIDCGACLKKCDFKKLVSDGISMHYPIKAYAAFHNDEQTLKSSTSGGVFSAFAEYVLNNGGCVYGCVMDDDFNVSIVKGETTEDIIPMRGSKYLQGAVNSIYKDIKQQLCNKRLVLFTGTPCQVAGLKSYLGKTDYASLITIDIICHGVSSVKSFQLYVSFLKEYKDIKIKKYHFRSKWKGWGLKTSAIEQFVEKNGKVEKRTILSRDDFFKSNYLSWNTIRPSCSSCKYATNLRAGDFTMGDFWGWEKLGLKIPTQNGLSALLCNFDKWEFLLKTINMTLVEVPVETVLEGNGALNSPTKKGRFWNAFMQCVANNNYTEFYKGFEKFKKERKRKEIIKRLKMIIPLPIKKLIHFFIH